MTDGRVTLGPGTLYGAINSMLTKGWVNLYSEDKKSRKKKEYIITNTGKEIEVICFFIELFATINSGSYTFGIFTVLLAVISLAMLKIVWKCNWKIEEYKHEKDI